MAGRTRSTGPARVALTEPRAQDRPGGTVVAPRSRRAGAPSPAAAPTCVKPGGPAGRGAAARPRGPPIRKAAIGAQRHDPACESSYTAMGWGAAVHGALRLSSLSPRGSGAGEAGSAARRAAQGVTRQAQRQRCRHAAGGQGQREAWDGAWDGSCRMAHAVSQRQRAAVRACRGQCPRQPGRRLRHAAGGAGAQPRPARPAGSALSNAFALGDPSRSCL